jgi:flagellar motility protein MotE (MotC chaperone)
MNGKKITLWPVIMIVMGSFILHTPAMAAGQEDPLKGIEQKRQELNEREDRLKKEEERLKAVQKEVEGKIEKLNQMLSQLEESLKKLGEVRSERMGHLVKTFEAMPPEEAAVRLSTIEKSLAVQIVFKMTSKKAGAVLASMDPKKVAEITEGVSRTEKKIPPK